MCVHGTINVVMFAVAGNDTRKFKYTISTSTKETRKKKTRSLFLSLSLSLSFFVSLLKKPNEFFSQERLQKEQIGVGFKVYEDVVARHASRGADSKLSNALDDGIFYHVISQFSFVE